MLEKKSLDLAIPAVKWRDITEIYNIVVIRLKFFRKIAISIEKTKNIRHYDVKMFGPSGYVGTDNIADSALNFIKNLYLHIRSTRSEVPKVRNSGMNAGLINMQERFRWQKHF